MKYYVWVGMAVLLVGCQKETAEMPPEDYSKFISLKEADKLPLELGVPFNCFPKHPGDWGVTPSDEFQMEDKNTYSIELNFYARADIHNRQDPTNLTAMVIQYLDTDNRLVVDTLYDGKNCITSKVRNGVLSFPASRRTGNTRLKRRVATSSILPCSSVRMGGWMSLRNSMSMEMPTIRSTACSTSIAGTRNPSISPIMGWTT